MLPSSRVVAIDDRKEHLEGLVRGLNRMGTACLPVHFGEGTEDTGDCPHVRLIFADLHLHPGAPGDHSQNFSTLGSVIESIRPAGPYVIVLWTQYPDQAEKLRAFLVDRLEGVRQPIAVRALDKAKHLNSDRTVVNADAVVASIRKLMQAQPQIGALLNWEERTLGAVGDTVASIMGLAESAAEGAEPSNELRRLLGVLGREAAGKKHSIADPFRAVNDALLPILADRIASLPFGEDDRGLWLAAVGTDDLDEPLSMREVVRLNGLLHTARLGRGSGGERGAVIALPNKFSGKGFKATFGLPVKEAAEEHFGRTETGEDDDLRWSLVQTQAACDYAQMRSGSLPFHLGILLAPDEIRSDRQLPAAVWGSPAFEFAEEDCVLHVNSRFQVPLTKRSAKLATPYFRLREQVLNNLIHHIHGYGARPGMISFREPKRKSKKVNTKRGG